VRVDQVGYAPHAAKRAYLISTAPESGNTFTIRRADGTTALRGNIGRSLGKVNAKFRYVYSLDFGDLVEPGRYWVAVAGPPAASSPKFQIAEPGSLYGPALRNALAFYRAQRDGPGFIRSDLRTAPGHLNDRNAQTYRPPATNPGGYFSGDLKPLPDHVDASGGWSDAGDYLKFVETTSYTVDLLLAGVRDFSRSMGSGSRRSNFTAEARFGLDWLLRMWDDRARTMYFQVGIGEGNRHTIGDHDIWRLPQADDHLGGTNPAYRYIRHRPVFRAGPPGSPVSPNLAGRDAAAFALCFQVFHHSDPRFAARCLLDGEHVFALANTHPHQLLTAVPHTFYPETEWRDDLELGATELARALSIRPLPLALPHTSAAYYLRRAASWARAYMRQRDAGDPLNLYDVSGLADYELYRTLQKARRPRKLDVGEATLLSGMHQQLRAAAAQSGKDPFGAGYPWNSWDTASHLAGLSVMASEYASLTGSSRYRNWSARWLDNVLGANAWGSSFIIGDGSTFPHCPHHQVANLAGSLGGGPPVLRGGVVEGPNGYATSGFVQGMRRCPSGGRDPFAQFDGRAVFKDNVQSYSTVEPAIDLTASSPLAFAWQIAGQ
jgi:endoglucanase